MRKKLTQEEWFEISFFNDWQLEPHEVKELLAGESYGLSFQNTDMDPDGIIMAVREIVYGEYKEPPGTEESLARKLEYQIEKEKEEIEEGEEAEASEMVKTPGSKRPSAAEGNGVETESVEKDYLTIPGIWVPSNQRSKVVALRCFFPIITNKYDLPELDVTPPHLVVAFDAFKKKEVLEVANDYPHETMKMGFFTSSDPETAKLLAKTPQGFDRIIVPPL